MAAIRELKRVFRNDDVYDKILALEVYVEEGVYTRLTKSINQLKKQINKMTKDGSKITDHKLDIQRVIESLYDTYHIPESRQKKDQDFGDPIIVTSETFE
jgi:hypothetical protein